MKQNIYSIFDTASGLYSRPFFATADELAKRDFGTLAQDADHPIGLHPKDYTLFRLGVWDDTRGELHNEPNESLATALEIISASRNVNRDNLELFDKELVHQNKAGTERYGREIMPGGKKTNTNQDYLDTCADGLGKLIP